MAVLQWPKAGRHNALLQTSGVALANTSYNVYLSDGTTLASIYTDTARSGPRTQPLTTDSSGMADFCTDPYSGLLIKVGANSRAVNVLPDTSDLFGTKLFSDGGANTTYTLSGSDNLKDLGFLAGTAAGVNCAITIPNTILKDFACRVLHEGGAGNISFVAGSGTTLHSFGITSNTLVYHPGSWAYVQVTCRFNGSGTQADVVLSPGVATAPV